MASSEVSEVLYCEEDLSMGGLGSGLDMPVECVQEVVTDSAFHLEGDSPIIYGDELIVTAEDVPQSEEIVGASCNGGPDDPLVGLYDGVPVPSELDAHVELRKFVRKSNSHHHHHHHHSSGIKTLIKPKRETFFDDYDTKIRSHHGTWQQKQVSIKTLEGEFSVTMWASGADDGKFL